VRQYTVGYPSDSLASCPVYSSNLEIFIVARFWTSVEQIRYVMLRRYVTWGACLLATLFTVSAHRRILMTGLHFNDCIMMRYVRICFTSLWTPCFTNKLCGWPNNR